MPKNKGKIFVIAGAVLILLALSLYFYNQIENHKAGREAEEVLETMLSWMGKNWEMEEEDELEIDGNLYIGYITIPSLSLELPVMSEWSYANLKIAPCRQFGSVKENSLVIAAHNYSRHFGSLKYLSGGDEVYFTSIDGMQYAYKVAIVETLNPTQVDEVQNSDYDLVLYTCTLGGKSRVTVFCDRIDN